MRYWAYTIGTLDVAPPREWFDEWDHHVTEMWFSKNKRPRSISRGDRAVFYGSRASGFLGAVEVTSDAPRPNLSEPNKARFPWVMEHRLLVAKACDDNVATPESAGIKTSRIQRGPHTELDRAEYERAVESLVRAAQLSART